MTLEFTFPKPKRIKNPALLEVIRALPCLACQPGTQSLPTEAHHVSTRGSGGDDVVTNLMPLCSQHHREWHQSTGAMIRKYRSVRYWLESAERWDVLERIKRT